MRHRTEMKALGLANGDRPIGNVVGWVGSGHRILYDSHIDTVEEGTSSMAA